MTKLAIIPFTVLLKTIFLKKQFSQKIKFSLFLLLVGVGIASITDLQLNFVGAILSLLAVITTCVGQILTNTIQKRLNVSSTQLLYQSAPFQAAILFVSGPWVDQCLTKQNVFAHKIFPYCLGFHHTIMLDSSVSEFQHIFGNWEDITSDISSVGTSQDMPVQWTGGHLAFSYMSYCMGQPPSKVLAIVRATLFNVVGQPLRFPETPQVSFMARDLIRGLLVKEPHKRIAYKRGATEIKQHPFFDGVNWALVRSAMPPYIPEPVDFGHFASKETAHADKKMAEIGADTNKNSPNDSLYVDFEYF
ncbi:hypothetical protein ACSBR1_018045 [Camellia fascicularis]